MKFARYLLTMSRTQESGAYLGGIGAMLEVANVCPACGEAHSDRQFGFKHRSARECPRVVMGSFPVATMPTPPLEAPIRVPAARQIQAAENSPLARVSQDFGVQFGIRHRGRIASNRSRCSRCFSTHLEFVT